MTPRVIRTPRAVRSFLAVGALASAVGLTACGSSDADATSTATTLVAAADDGSSTEAAAADTGDTAADTATDNGVTQLDPNAGGAGGPGGDGDSPFDAVVACLNENGLDVTAPDFGPGGDRPDFDGDGAPPAAGSMPAPPDGGSMPAPPDGGSVPDGGQGGPPGFGGDPTEMLTQMLGLDASDATVAAALDACSDLMTFPGPDGDNGPPPGAPSNDSATDGSSSAADA